MCLCELAEDTLDGLSVWLECGVTERQGLGENVGWPGRGGDRGRRYRNMCRTSLSYWKVSIGKA